jgi:four helix bundle protein
MTAHNFKDLKVWQMSINLTKEVYDLTSTFPTDEKWGLTSQIKRCAVSIPSNIAEGSGRNSNQDFSRFLGIALGSSYELETQLILAEKLNLISTTDLDNISTQLISIQKIIFSLQRKFGS